MRDEWVHIYPLSTKCQALIMVVLYSFPFEQIYPFFIQWICFGSLCVPGTVHGIWFSCEPDNTPNRALVFNWGTLTIKETTVKKERKKQLWYSLISASIWVRQVLQVDRAFLLGSLVKRVKKIFLNEVTLKQGFTDVLEIARLCA